MKKFVTLVFTFLLFTLLTPAFAQTTHQIYVHDIQSNKIIYQTGENVQGTFTISNLGTTAQSDIYYVISSGNYIEKTFTMVNDINPSDKIGPIYVKSQSKDKINFSYTLPQSISGNIAVQITALLKDGTLVGQGRLPLVVEGKPNKNLAYVENPFLMISNFKDIISPDAGPTVYKGETISYNFSISPTTKTYIIKPVLKIYNRAENKDSLKKTIELDPIKTDLKSTFHEFLLPVDLDPLVYYGVISFESNDVEIPSQSLRYIISGPIATIRNITADKLEVSKGDEFAVTVSYGGQPADEFRPEKQIAPPSATITLSATNENGEVIGESTQPLNLKDANKNLNIPIISKVSAKVISFKSAIKDASGKILSEYSTTLPTKASVSGQESYIKRNATPLVTILIVIILLIAVIVILVMRKKHKFIHVPLAFFAIAMILIASVSAVKNVKAWEIIYKAGALFTVNAVVSPLPPEIKSYNPGERFNLSVSMLTSDCNNEPWYAYTYASRGTTLPASDSEWKLLDTDTANIVISGSATLSGWQKNKINSYIWGLQEPAYTSIPETNLRRSLRAKYLEKKAEDPSIANISGVLQSYQTTATY